jgi:hypothetical protein
MKKKKRKIMAKREVVGFRIDKRLAKLLKLYAVEKDRRYNEVVEEAILEYLSKRGVEIPEELKHVVGEKATTSNKK